MPADPGAHYNDMTDATLRDCYGISELPTIQLILPYKISCIKVSSEIPLLSLLWRLEPVT